MIKILVVYSRQRVPTASDHAFVANVKVTSPCPGFSLEYARVIDNSGTLQQQQTMLFSYWSVSSGWHSRADLCQHKVSEWTFAHQNLSQKLFGYPLSIYSHVKKLIYSEGTLQHYLLLLFNICLALINFNNSGLTYIRCSKWKVYLGWISQWSDVF